MAGYPSTCAFEDVVLVPRRDVRVAGPDRSQLQRARVGRIERMNLAVLRRDVEDAHLLAPAAAIRVRAQDDGRARLQRVAVEPVDERLRDAEAFAFDERRLAVGARVSTIKYICGLTQSNRATLPSTKISLDWSNMAWL